MISHCSCINNIYSSAVYCCLFLMVFTHMCKTTNLLLSLNCDAEKGFILVVVIFLICKVGLKKENMFDIFTSFVMAIIYFPY